LEFKHIDSDPGREYSIIMFNEASEILNKNLFQPFLFIVIVMGIYFLVSIILYYKFLKWIPEKLATIIGFLGAVFVFIKCIDHYQGITDLVNKYSAMNIISGVILFVVIVLVGGLAKGKKRSNNRGNRKDKTAAKYTTKSRRASTECRTDDVILCSNFNDLSGAEFERLLALYFNDQGYKVKEVGVGGKDGGVDLVITDQRGEKTAVQAKCYSDHNLVGVQTVRELVGAKRNHDCILSLLITTSDLTQQAKKEAEQFKVDYWHGGVVEEKLRIWGKWQPDNKPIKKKEINQSQAESTTKSKSVPNAMKCTCGAEMVMRKGKEGKSFWGCSTFPRCRQTKSIS
jgi:restriction system protein